MGSTPNGNKHYFVFSSADFLEILLKFVLLLEGNLVNALCYPDLIIRLFNLSSSAADWNSYEHFYLQMWSEKTWCKLVQFKQLY